MSKVTQYLLWKELISHIPLSKDRTIKEHKKYERYRQYIKNTTPTEKDWVEHTFALLQRDHT